MWKKHIKKGGGKARKHGRKGSREKLKCFSLCPFHLRNQEVGGPDEDFPF